MTAIYRAVPVRLLLALSLVLASVASLALVQSVQAAEIDVPAGDVAALIAAINSANTNAGTDEIVLAAGSTYTLSAVDNTINGLPRITSEITITGNGATIERLEDAPDFRFFEVANNGSLQIDNLTLSNGDAGFDAGDGYGGAIYNKGGTLTVTRSTFLDNTATFGGGIGNRLGTTTVSDSTFTGNYSYGEGGGLASHANAMTVMNSTFTQNGSSAGGAGLMIRGGIVTLSNLTITKNEDRWPGAGIGIQFDDLTPNPASLLIINCTITENETDRFGGGIAVTPTPFYWPTITNTIIANNHAFTGDEDVNGGFYNGGHNLIGPMDLKAAPLGDYGGPTQTIALLSGSPAIDAGDNAAAPLTDQRGVTRPYNDIVDIGAFEVNDPTPPVITPTVTGTIGNNGWYISDVVVSWTVADAESPLQIENGCLETAINTDTVGTSVDCKAISGGGEASASVPITRDATHPVVSYAGNQPAYSLLETVSITCSASDATSGIATDTCADINGPAASFVPGVNTFSAAATDNAGHEAQASVSFTVAATHADLCALTTRYVSQRVVGHLACGALSVAQQASAHQFPFISSFALNLYRVQIHLATKRYVISPQHGAELINWSRTL